MLSTFKGISPQALLAIQEEKEVRKTKEIFLLFSLGSQFDHLIKQELEKLGVYCLVADPSTVIADDVKQLKPIGIILSGGPVSVHTNPPEFDQAIFDLSIPVLGICLGFQLWAQHVAIKVETSDQKEFGIHKLNIVEPNKLFAGIKTNINVLESHGDRIEINNKIIVLAKTANAPIAAARYKHLWGVQFHPEVTETEFGLQIIENFCFNICNANDRFPAAKVAEQKIKELKEEIGEKKVLLALSGGSDSSTVAYLLKNALRSNGGQIKAVYIRGIDRPDDEAYVLEYFSQEKWLELKVVDATADFIKALKGKVTMPEKRLAMRGVYGPLLENEAKKYEASFIAQGTLYTDISESGGGYNIGAEKAQIKLHHNVNLGFTIPELMPLSDCVKDSGRNIGRAIGVPEELLTRHPFPGPGLVVRIEGEVDLTKLTIAREIDRIYIAALRSWKLYESVWQAGAVLTNSMVTCTKGDDAISGYEVVLWAVWSVNGFTAQAAELPYDFLKQVATAITNNVREVGVVTYKLSGKPPSTIEWG
jgi:GMP synthase (glutamine-hydrolysing)